MWNGNASRETREAGEAGEAGLGRRANTNLEEGTGAEPGSRAEPDWILGSPGCRVKGRRWEAAHDWLAGWNARGSCGAAGGLGASAPGSVSRPPAGTHGRSNGNPELCPADSSRHHRQAPPPRMQRAERLGGGALRIRGGASPGAGPVLELQRSPSEGN